MKFSVLVIEIVCADPALLIGRLNGAGVTVFHLKNVSDLTFRIAIRESSYPAFRKIVEKRNESYKIVERLGFFPYLRVWLKRWVFLTVVLILGFLTVVLSGKILFIRVEGNRLVSKEEILYSASQNGIYFGAKRKDIRNEKVKNGILGDLPGIGWIGVNTRGCVAVISVEEEQLQQNIVSKTGVSSIVASRDALISKCVATNGTLLCSPGQAVTRGQVLISGYTDCGLKIQACHAQGEIFGYTTHQKGVVIPMEYAQKGEIQGSFKKYSLLFGKNCINLWKDSGISGVSCDKIYEEYYVVLPGGFVIPLGLRIETVQSYAPDACTLEEGQAEELAKVLCDEAVQKEMISGRVLRKSMEPQCLPEIFQLAGEYFCEEMIGRKQDEEILRSNG